MSKRKKLDDQPMTDEEYEQFKQLQFYDAAGLRALALWLNTKKKNAALMKAVTAESGRNARHMARAVDYFPVYFQQPFCDLAVAGDYLMLFEYAKLKHEDATALFGKHQFGTPLYLLRPIIAAVRLANATEHKAGLAEQCADTVIALREYAASSYVRDYRDKDLMDSTIDKFAVLPPVAKVLAARSEKAHAA